MYATVLVLKVIQSDVFFIVLTQWREWDEWGMADFGNWLIVLSEAKATCYTVLVGGKTTGLDNI